VPETQPQTSAAAVTGHLRSSLCDDRDMDAVDQRLDSSDQR
jgi:hypothetical protein